jgi:hypothetical protein
MTGPSGAAGPPSDEATEMLRVSTSDEKYTVVQAASGAVEVLRYGQPWRAQVFDSALLSLAYDLEESRAALASAEQRARTLALEEAARIARAKRDFWADQPEAPSPLTPREERALAAAEIALTIDRALGASPGRRRSTTDG